MFVNNLLNLRSYCDWAMEARLTLIQIKLQQSRRGLIFDSSHNWNKNQDFTRAYMYCWIIFIPKCVWYESVEVNLVETLCIAYAFLFYRASTESALSCFLSVTVWILICKEKLIQSNWYMLKLISWSDSLTQHPCSRHDYSRYSVSLQDFITVCQLRWDLVSSIWTKAFKSQSAERFRV